MMITIKGKEFSEETIVKALEKHCNFKEQYIFQSGDIVTCEGQPRVILETSPGILTAFCPDGYEIATGRTQFNGNNYVKIGTLDDFIGD